MGYRMMLHFGWLYEFHICLLSCNDLCIIHPLWGLLLLPWWLLCAHVLRIWPGLQHEFKVTTAFHEQFGIMPCYIMPVYLKYPTLLNYNVRCPSLSPWIYVSRSVCGYMAATMHGRLNNFSTVRLGDLYFTRAPNCLSTLPSVLFWATTKANKYKHKLIGEFCNSEMWLKKNVNH